MRKPVAYGAHEVRSGRDINAAIKPPTRIHSVLLMAAAISACSATGPPKPNIEHMLAHATTASDQEAIAEYYQQEAADAEVKYKEHKASAIQYEHSIRLRGWAQHCDQLAQDYKQAEEDASVLAAEHRKVAGEMSAGR